MLVKYDTESEFHNNGLHNFKPKDSHTSYNDSINDKSTMPIGIGITTPSATGKTSSSTTDEIGPIRGLIFQIPERYITIVNVTIQPTEIYQFLHPKLTGILHSIPPWTETEVVTMFSRSFSSSSRLYTMEINGTREWKRTWII